MTDISLSLSATKPGVWTLPVSEYLSVATQAPADDFGNPVGDPTSTVETQVEGGVLDVGDGAAPDYLNQMRVIGVTFNGTRLQNNAGLVTVQSYVNFYALETGDGPATLQTITEDGAWNAIKNIAVSNFTTDSVTVSNFVDVTVATDDLAAHSVDLEDAKRGTVHALGATNLTIHFLSNEYTWDNTFAVSLGDGSNVVEFEPATTYAAAAVTTLEPMSFNTAPQDSHLTLTVGDGANVINTQEGSASIHLGNGSDQVTMIDGHNELWLGNGGDTVTIDSEPRGPSAIPLETDIGTDVLHLGRGQPLIFLSDANAATMAQTTIIVPEVLGTTALATETLIQYGHFTYPSPLLVGGDWSHVSFDFTGFAANSSVSLSPDSDGATLIVTDPVDHAVRELVLQGDTPTLAQLHISFG